MTFDVNAKYLAATLYKLTKRLAHILSLPLTLHHTLAPALKSNSKGDPDGHKYDNIPPEVGFVATCIVVLKMVYGLDGKTRYTRSTVSNDQLMFNINRLGYQSLGILHVHYLIWTSTLR